MKCLNLTFFFLISISAHADEPGYFRIEENKTSPPNTATPSPPPPNKQISDKKSSARNSPALALDLEFARARGLNSYEAQGLTTQRISCDRRLYTSSGQAIEGDADLMATQIDGRFIHAELPSHYSLVAFSTVNPYQNGIEEIDSMSSAQLLRIQPWRDGSSLKLKKYLRIRFADDKKSDQVVPAIDEMRVIEGVYPPLFLIRESVLTEKPFHLYLICR